MTRLTVLAAGALAVLAVAACGESHGGHLLHRAPGPPKPCPPRTIEHTHDRAGDPLCVSPHAAPSITPSFEGYYVGGGTAHGGDSRRREEGTWGLDYVGMRLPRKVMLGWSHGRRDQGGTGSYTTDRVESRDPLAAAVNRLRGRRSSE